MAAKRSWLVLLALASCDRLLKLDDITPHGDGGGGGDGAQSSCPATGAPQFGGMRHALPELANCSSYTIGAPGWSSSELAIANCSGGIVRDDAGQLVVQQGVENYTLPVVTPYGELCAGSSAGATCFLRSATPETWQSPQVQMFDGMMLPLYDTISAPSGAPQDRDRRIMVFDLVSLNEYSGAAGAWVFAHKLDSTTLGVMPGGTPWLSSDALRLVFPAMGGGLYYAARASTADSFGTALEIYANPDGTAYPFVTADCSELYYEDSTDYNIYWVGRL